MKGQAKGKAKRSEDGRQKTEVKTAPLVFGLPSSVFGLLSSIVIFLFAFLLYSNTLHHGFVMDDGAVITDNVTVQKGFGGIKELFKQSSVYGSTKENFGNYRPVTMTVFAIGKGIFGNNPARFHFMQVLLYGLCCVIIFLTLRKLLKDYNPLFPFLAMLLFVAHPLHTEVGAFVKSMDETISLSFCMAALLFAALYATSGKAFHAILSWLFFLLSLFSKESAVTFLFIIPMALLLFTNVKRKAIIQLSTFYFIAVLFYLFMRSAVLSKMPEGISIINNSLSAATSFSERFGTIFYILFRYIRLLIYPDVLSWDYGYNQIPLVTFSNIAALSSVLFHIGIAFYAVFILIKLFRSKPGAPDLRSRILAFCILFYFATLSTSSNIVVPIAATMGEQFVFAPSIAFCLIVAMLILLISGFDLTSKKGLVVSSNRRYIIMTVIVLPILVFYSMRTWSRNPDWKSNYTLFGSGAATSPNSYRTNTTFAWENLKAGEADVPKGKDYFVKAQYYFQRAVSIYGKEANDWYNLAISNYHLGDTNATMAAYEKALEVRPNHSKSCYNLAALYFNKKNYAQALKYFQCAYSSDASLSDAFFKTGVCYHLTGDIKNAIAVFEKYLASNPGNHDATQNLAVEYGMIGDAKKSEFYTRQLKK